MISIAFEEVDKAIILFSALWEQKIKQVRFKDPVHCTSFAVSYSMHENTSRGKRSATTLILQFEDYDLPITDTWFQAIYAMLLNVWLNGWNETAHLDEDFLYKTEQISLCFEISPPSFPCE